MADSLSLIDQVIADWILMNPPADSVESCSNMFSTIELLHIYYLNSGDESITQEKIITELKNSGYTFEAGYWLTK